MPGSSERAIRGLSRLLLRVFYRDAEIREEEAVPSRGPVLFVANHGNALVDPMVLIALLPRVPRFLAKHTLWKNPAVRPLLGLAGAIPVYRAQDGGTTGNDQTFSRCFEELADGRAVALFPEGISHDEPSLQPLRTGAARIALGAAGAGAPPVTVVPVGLTFEEKGRFRSRLLVTIGTPIVPDADATVDDAQAVRALTEQIDEGLRRVTLNFDSWERARLAERSAELYASGDAHPLPGRPALGEQFSLRRAIGGGYEAARAADPDRIAAAEALVQRYESLLSTLNLRDDQVTAEYPWRHALSYVGYRIPLLLTLLPLALVGFVLNYLPYRLPGWVANLVREKGDQPATFKVLTGLVAFPLFWGVLSGSTWLAVGPGAGIAMALLAPLSGWIALRFFERNQSFWGELRAFFTLRLLPERGAELRALRQDVRDQLASVIESSGSRG